MKNFFDDKVLLEGNAALELYDRVKNLPIIDYHCHLNPREVAEDKKFSDIGELWLAGDHYKWRAMRLCGVPEHSITSEQKGHAADRGWKQKFFSYAEIMPKLAGNPLYYFSHFELKKVFGVNKAISADSAPEIHKIANQKLKELSVRALLEQFKVEYIATTDDPADELTHHGNYGNFTLAPTFRPDAVFSFEKDEFKKLGNAAGIKIKELDDLKYALLKRLDYFASKGCRISDHGFEDFPDTYLDDKNAKIAFHKSPENVRGHLMLWLLREYNKRGMTAQLHFSVTRNNNSEMYQKVGPDAGFDLMSGECNYENLITLLDLLPDNERPPIILYSLNPNASARLANISGAFRNVHIGAAWWFNDTLEGIRRHLSIVAEYGALGTNLGIPTDSRSFLSYVRVDFFRRVLCNYIGQKVELGEYAAADAAKLAEDICYHNIKRLLFGNEKKK